MMENNRGDNRGRDASRASGLGHECHPGLYIHIPFCRSKCKYCGFLSGTSTEEQRAKYVEYLRKECVLRAKECEGLIFDTVYLGGGTPTVLSNRQLSTILDEYRKNYQITEDAEITIEANPGTLGDSDEEVLARLTELRAMGFNRLSMGAQSMDDERLSFIGRIHDSATVRRDFKLAREAGFDNINLDIIFSIPGETTEDALRDIREIAELSPEHISFYSLQLEEGTAFFEMWENREFEEVSDEADRETYHRGSKLLAELGYEHYEISNFARKGRRSKHNSKYWAMAWYSGQGLGASGYMHGARYVNESGMAEWCEAIDSARLPIAEEHRNTRHDHISEAIFTGLRRAEGISYAELQMSQDEVREYYSDVWQEALGFVKSGHLIIDEEGMRLTEQGIDISNRVMALFV